MSLCQSGFYSRYSLVPKRGSGICHILDLRALNRHLRKYNSGCLHMHLCYVSYDWFLSVNLKDAYFTFPFILLTESSSGLLSRGSVTNTAYSPLASP